MIEEVIGDVEGNPTVPIFTLTGLLRSLSE
jgi:hypothetical protein